MSCSFGLREFDAASLKMGEAPRMGFQLGFDSVIEEQINFPGHSALS